jgi:hypothetical protein
VTETVIVRGARGKVSLRTAASSFAVLFALLAGCSSERPPPAGDSAPVFAGGGSSGGGGFSDAGRALPGCGAQADGTACACQDVPLFADAPNMYFVLDRSGSMAEDDKWGTVRKVVAQITRGLGPRANFGATIFPGLDSSSCDPPREVLPLTPGDPPGVQDGPTTTKLIQATASTPSGGTPTAEALREVLQSLKNTKGKTFVILATDGGPNCNAGISCSVEACQPNIDNVPGCIPGGTSCCAPPVGTPESCLDSAATISAVSALKTAGISVYVVGLPGTSAPAYAALLDQLATAGGTALPSSPKYYRVDSTNGDVLLAALKKISAQIVATCAIQLKSEPAQANEVNVYLDEAVLPQDPVNGWKIDGSTVTLLGTACTKVLSGDVLDVRIVFGCPTVGPK